MILLISEWKFIHFKLAHETENISILKVILYFYVRLLVDLFQVVNLFSKYGETVSTVRVSKDAVKDILEIVKWPSMPLIFVKVVIFVQNIVR